MSDDFSQCMVTNSRKAARAITRRYDAYARPFGITSMQFSLLGTIHEAGDQTVSQLAERGGFERTTLTRNLDRLEALGLIASRAAAHGNGRLCMLTGRGRDLLAQLLPEWRRAQAAIRAELSSETFDLSLNVLKQLAKV